MECIGIGGKASFDGFLWSRPGASIMGCMDVGIMNAFMTVHAFLRAYISIASRVAGGLFFIYAMWKKQDEETYYSEDREYAFLLFQQKVIFLPDMKLVIKIILNSRVHGYKFRKHCSDSAMG